MSYIGCVGAAAFQPDFAVCFFATEPPFSSFLQVRNDFLDLHVPVWVTDIGFLPNQGSQSKITVGTGYHQVRLYDTKTQRRPVLSVDFAESPISALAVTDNEQ